ncbi:hypothetical protein MSG28_014916 [Choristoneura fumiferana]|uniref:Uncharacterized protein n=1 Tax=Choristoneura fumiferana TaxID=7141 RepID=A0ACC0KXR5_CHOFU|nr:hypothetical protein MSG28_014916 [Choristoneura fumiferana]
MLHSTMQSSVIKERIGDDSDSEGLISAALILRDRKEGVTSIKPTVNVQFQSPTPFKLPRSYVVVKDEVTMQVEPPNSAISLNFKTCDTPTQICDLQDTFAHLLYCQQQMKTQYYTKFLKSMICYKFIDGPDYFIIKSKSNKFFCFSKDEVIDKVKGKRRFDWIRSKRSVSVSNNDATNRNNDNEEVSDDLGEANEGKDGSDAAYSLLADSVPNDGFEVMVKDKYGIYRSVEGARLKRTTCTDRIGEELRNLPPIDIPKNMIYAIEGETVTLTCYPKVECPGRLTWWVDTPHAQDNVMVDGEQLVITAVKPGNVANYSCGQGNMVLNTTGIRVVSLPIYDVVTTPLYICNKHCSDHELKVMHELGPQMTDVGCLSGSCVIKIDRPRCLTDLASNASLLSVRSIMRLPRRAPPCGIECARDAHGSWAVVAATSAPLLAKIKGTPTPTHKFISARDQLTVQINARKKSSGWLVEGIRLHICQLTSQWRDGRARSYAPSRVPVRISLTAQVYRQELFLRALFGYWAYVVVERDNSNVTLTPTTDSHRRLVLSMTLTDDPNIINQAPFAVVPGDIEVVVSCPHGYVLVAKLRICSDSTAKLMSIGLSTVATPPAIDRSYTGRSRRLHSSNANGARKRFYWFTQAYFSGYRGKTCFYRQWWQWPVWCVVVGGLLAVGGAGAACVRRGARDPRPTKRAPDREHTQLVFHRVSAAASSASGPAPVPRRRISPSRVILPRLFRHASSRISQETKLGSAKKHQAPPLPPIDFDS